MRRSQPTKKIEIWIVILEMSSQIDSSNRSFCWAKHIREINQHKIYHTGNTLFDSHPNSGTNNILFRVREYFTIMLDSFILLNAILYYISTLTFIFLNIIWKIKIDHGFAAGGALHFAYLSKINIQQFQPFNVSLISNHIVYVRKSKT